MSDEPHKYDESIFNDSYFDFKSFFIRIQPDENLRFDFSSAYRTQYVAQTRVGVLDDVGDDFAGTDLLHYVRCFTPGGRVPAF